MYGWGDNDHSQLTAIQGDSFIPTPQALKIPLNAADNTTIVSGNGTAFLLSSKPLETEFDKFISPAQESQTPKVKETKD